MHDDLKRRLRDEVDTELGTRPLSDLSDVLRRGRRKRLGIRLIETVSMVLLVTAVVAGGLWIGRTTSSDDGRNSIQPADAKPSPSEPTPSETPENAEVSGRRVDLLNGEVTFRSSTWGEHAESRIISEAPMGPESLLRHESPSAGLLVVTDPAPLQESCSRSGATVASAEVFADAIRSHPGLSSTAPVVERIGGVDALRLDVAPVEGASTCRGTGLIIEERPPMVGVPVITGTRETYFGPSLAHVLEGDQRMRLYLLDFPGGTAKSLAIVIVAAEADFDATLEAARPILDSFEFQTAQQED